MQAFPDAARAFRDVGLRAAPVVHLEVLVGAVAKELRATGPEVGKPCDVLLGRRGGWLVEVNRGHLRAPYLVLLDAELSISMCRTAAGLRLARQHHGDGGKDEDHADHP